MPPPTSLERILSIHDAAAGRPLTTAQRRDLDTATGELRAVTAGNPSTSQDLIHAAAWRVIEHAETEHRDLTEAELTSVRNFAAKLEEQRRVEDRAQRAEPARDRFQGAISVQVTRNESTYRSDGEHSYVRDIIASSRGDWDAAERLHRNSLEAADDRERRDGTTGSTSMGSFIPPKWLLDETATYARAGRILANLVTFAGPPTSNSITVPRVTTGSSVAGQAGDNAAVSETDMVTAQLTRSTVTIAGQQDVSIQSLDLGGPLVDRLIFSDLRSAYEAELDRQILRGSGTNELLGLNQVSGINTVTYTDASPTVPELYPKVADAIQQAAVGRKLAPTLVVMHPRRWGWITAALDSSLRPLVVPSGMALNAVAVFSSGAREGLVGEIQGVPVYGDSNVATTLGGGTEDQLVVAHGPSTVLLESPVQTRILNDVLSGNLTVRLQLWSYVNLFAGRYPTSISTIGGTGLATPTF